MKVVDFWFDALSPYAWLAFDRLPQALEGLNVVVNYQPVLLAGLLAHWGQKGPAEITPKRAWTYRQVLWQAHQQGTPLQLPKPHPFNPLALQRLAVAAAPAGGTPSRRTVELLFRHVWCRDGADPNEPAALAALHAAVAPQRDPAGDAVKAELRARTEAAVALGLFGVPTLVADGRHFFGLDALPMLRAALAGDAWFDGPGWDDGGNQPPGLQRRA
ncbi:2-hydroxychromene-2-carboxylate isomerase [Pseudaquabacterium pictum]|uniref:2-hydroxychromene-2-carboxylate isomerase n=1 Tax=Pseudaquabacterium pictum TaxID=2315236 RepID=A0A480AQJ8_9BURK|nr:2-hydroxychromene-2-carboxylate isomerase [Rubrivivax pictus]GCL63909.1 isomerase [Rubrivivax pictus]